MIEITHNSDPDSDYELRIVMAPNRSLDWNQNKKVIWALGGVCGGIAMGFTILVGAWVMLPFAGLEIAALTAGLYYASWKLSYRHVLTFTRDSVVIEKGVYRPRGRWIWPKQSTHLQSTPAAHDWEAIKLTLHNPPTSLNIGTFLSPQDVAEVATLVSQHILYKKT
ncbi:DUF2244 domain-containing protein [Pseudomonadales bacterium]|nr:DUF2244 domain-containing protein [Pseudomonadales bacterium]MDA8965466.1 DUF2244 domain-containing protein [Pseudomonadales bacterium]MDB4420828.1 DUF2244 domain-containing protein [Pseudomonadales bacterium]MDB4493329.1 DUF2244 domain-containing protein [Pseudomonadales bacterium]